MSARRRAWRPGAAGCCLALAAAATALARPDDAAGDRLLLRQAVAAQQRARAEERPEQRREGLEAAVRLYREYLAHAPESGVALNNLARAYEDLGQRKPAAECFEKAIALNDSRRLFYLENYARALSEAGDWVAAAPVYKRLVREQPLASGPHAALMQHYLSADPKGLNPYLWELLDTGQPERACLGALDALAEPAGGAEDELLGLVAAGLSRMTYDLDGLGGSEAGRKLRELASRAGRVGACLQQVLKLHEEPGQPGDYGCWRYRDAPHTERPSSSQAFQALMRAVGRRHRARGDAARASGDAAAARGEFDVAERYLRGALELNKGLDVDPVAFEELIGLEVGRNDLGAVAKLADEYQQTLFESKALAYAERQDQRIYQFHKALGEMYAVLGVWGSSSDARSAIFQLEHAREASTRLEQRDGVKAPKQYRFTPEMTNLLAQGYGGTNRSKDGWKLRLDQAEKYRKAGDDVGAEEVLAPVRNATPPPELKPRYEGLRKATQADLTVLGAARPGAQEVHVHRTQDLQIRFGAAVDRGRPVRLSAEQREALYASLEKYLEGALAGDAPAPAWADAPAGVEGVRIDAKGRGVLKLEVEGKPAEVPFEVRSAHGRALEWKRE